MELAIDSMHMQPASSLHYCQNTVSLHIQGYFRQAEACRMEGTYLRKRGELRDASTAFQRAVRGYIECYNRSRPKDVDLLCQAIKLAVDCSKFAITSYPGLLPPAVVACSTNTGKTDHMQWRTWMLGECVEEWHVPRKTASKWVHYQSQNDHGTAEHLTSGSLGDTSWVQKAALQLYRKNVPLLHTSTQRSGTRDQFYQVFPCISTAIDKCWGEVRG